MQRRQSHLLKSFLFRLTPPLPAAASEAFPPDVSLGGDSSGAAGPPSSEYENECPHSLHLTEPSSCPYRVIYWNDEENVPQKCNLCAHLLDQGWEEPRCVETCPTGALIFGDLDDPESGISKQLAVEKPEILRPEFEMNPSVCYIGLPKRFITGEVVFADKMDECAPVVKVTLSDGSNEITTMTDHFGDFEFEGLDSNQSVTIKLEHYGYVSQEIQVKTIKDINLGEIVLEVS